MRLDKGMEAGVLLVQGILAGLSLASMYAVLLGGSLQSFIAAYEVQIRTKANDAGSTSRLSLLSPSKLQQ